MKLDIIKSVRFLARDTTGQLYGFDKRPHRVEMGVGRFYWTSKKEGYMIFIRERDESLSFIKNDDEKPWVIDVLEDSEYITVLELINDEEVYKIVREFGVIRVKKENYIDVAIDEPIFTSEQSVEIPKTKVRKFIEKILNKLKL